ncbi:MAG TPA: type II secretion system protein [Phycisphaerae bacterium]|nr:type II secretion system protein [Phycisphaerae bacterium]
MITRRQPGFTLIELLVVVAVISILIGAIITVSSVVIAGAKAKDTQAMLIVLDQAIDQFKEDMTSASKPWYQNATKGRYAENYPPDELEAFTVANEAPTLFTTIAPGGDLEDDTGSGLTLNNVAQRDVKAMALAIKLFSPAGSEILDRIGERFKVAEPRQGLRRTNPFVSFEPLVYFVDSWGTPIEYYATAAGTENASTDSGGDRRKTSKALVAANSGVPLLVSYGPDGPDQFSQDFIDTEGESDLVADFSQADPVRTIDHRLNADNVYSNPDMNEKLLKQLPDPGA